MAYRWLGVGWSSGPTEHWPRLDAMPLVAVVLLALGIASAAAPNHPSQVSLIRSISDGCSWQPGFNVDDLDNWVAAFAVFDDGTGEALYAGGFIGYAGGVLVSGIAKWDGTSWSALSGPFATGVGSGLGVYSLAVFDDGTGPALYAGGDFTTAGGVTVNNIARWDGSSWSALSGPSGTGIDDTVYALAVHDDGTGPAL
jgi:hypothetical protein